MRKQNSKMRRIAAVGLTVLGLTLALALPAASAAQSSGGWCC